MLGPGNKNRDGPGTTVVMSIVDLTPDSIVVGSWSARTKDISQQVVAGDCCSELQMHTHTHNMKCLKSHISSSILHRQKYQAFLICVFHTTSNHSNHGNPNIGIACGPLRSPTLTLKSLFWASSSTIIRVLLQIMSSFRASATSCRFCPLKLDLKVLSVGVTWTAGCRVQSNIVVERITIRLLQGHLT